MRIIFAHLLSGPFLAAALGVLYYAWEHDGAGAGWIVPFLLIAALIWVLAPQINWWWYSKRPPALEEGVVVALERFSRCYQELDETERVRFRERLALTRMATDWTPKNMPEDAVPPDIQTAVSCQSVIMTWNKEEYLFGDFEKIIVSPDAFLSPEYPFNHHSELYAPENCMLFSAKSVIEGFTQPDQHFNVALYEYAKAFVLKYGAPDLKDLDWEQLETVSGWSRQFIEYTIGIAGVELIPAAITLFHHHPERFTELAPDLAKTLKSL